MESEIQKYKDLFDTLEVGVVYQDNHGKIIEVNHVAEQILGFTMDQMKGLDSGSDKWKAVKEDGSSFPGSEHPSMIALSTGKRVIDAVMGIYNPRLKQRRWININAIPEFRKGEKKAFQVFTAIRDVTERLTIGMALRESEEKFRNLADESPNMIFINLRGRVVYANKACEKYTKYKTEEFFNERFSFLSLIDEEYIDLVKESFNKHLKGIDVPPYEYRLICKDGSKLDVIITTKLFSYQNENAILGIVTDITERKNSEKALFESEKRFRSMIERSSDAIALLDANGIVIYNSPSVPILTGFSSEERIGRNAMDTVHPEDIAKLREILKNLVGNPGGTTGTEFRAIRKDGSVWWAEGTATNMLHEPSINAIVINYRDISDRKKAEESLKKQNKEYQSLNKEYLSQNEELINSLKKIKRINAELLKAKEEAVESDRLKTAFLANMSHEIRTPMNGIIGFADLLREPQLTGSQQRKYVDVIQQGGYRMLNIINDLIDIAKIEADLVEIRMVDININRLLENLYIFFKPEAEKKQLNFSCRKGLPDSESLIRTDPVKLNQILSNLIKNALKFTHEGLIEFGYRIAETKDALSQLQFYVKDTGTGIDHALKEKIFERFRQGDISDTTGHEGAGLGLSISKAFVEMLEGKIWLESQLNKGSTFFFTLPYNITGDLNKQQKPVEVEIPDTFKANTLLVVEDDEISFQFIKEILTRNGLQIIRAVNGEEAIQQIEDNLKIRLVLMDIKMPVMNGFDATRRIKQLRPDLPVIAQTAYASEEDRQKSLGAGCDDYISKPINKELLMSIIRKFV